MPVKVLNDDGTEVTDDTEFGESVSFCFDTEDIDGDIQRKLIKYELKSTIFSNNRQNCFKEKSLEYYKL